MSRPSVWPRILGLAAGLAASATGLASERVHTVLPGESASSLAKRYYGDTDLGDLLLLYNERKGSVIKVGERLTIPSCEVHRVRKGDSWSVLAKRFLDRASSSAALAELNGFAPERSLRVGDVIVAPVVLRHVLARGETLATLAEQFYGDPRKAGILRSFGRIEDPKRIAVGTVVEIPLIDFRPADEQPAPAPPRPEEAAVLPPTPPPVEERRYESTIGEARLRFADGDYEGAREILESKRAGVAPDGTAWDRGEWARLLAFAYIALDRDDQACAVFRLAPAGAVELDPDLVSPRIRNTLAACPASAAEPVRLDTPGSAAQIPPHADAGR